MEIWNNSLLISSGGWDDVEQAAKNVQSTVVTRLLEQRVVPLSLGLSYWSAVRSSGPLGLSLFYAQQSPLYAYRLLKDPELRRPPLALRSWRTSIVWRGTIKERASSLLQYIVSQWRRFKTFVYRPVHVQAKIHTKQLVDARNEVAAHIGAIILAGGTAQEHVARLASAAGLDSASLNLDTPESCLATLQAVLDQLKDTSGSTVTALALPPAWVRWWPAAVSAIVSAYYLNGSWDKLLNWFETSVLETLRAFWHNWLVDPLYRIYLTIRHDPNGEVALIAKESLTSDVASLVQMVVDFARDTDPTLSIDDLDVIRQEARNGNVSPVMAVYNKQLEAPITNLVTGKLIRTLLIQVQKSKVDAEVAISGIDQLLGSQQLVFGFLAALPALGLVTYVVRGVMASDDHMTELRESVLVRLGNIDEVVQNAAAHKHKLEELELGLIYCEIALIKRASALTKSEGQKQFIKTMNRLLELAVTTRDTNAVLDMLDRIYVRFSFYS